MEAEREGILPGDADPDSTSLAAPPGVGSLPAAQRISEIRAAMAALERQCATVRPRVFLQSALASSLWLLYFGLILVLPMYHFRSFQPPISPALFVTLLLLSYLLLATAIAMYQMLAYSRDPRRLPAAYNPGGFLVSPQPYLKLLKEGLAGSGLAEKLVANEFDDPAMPAEPLAQLRHIAGKLPQYSDYDRDNRGRHAWIANVIQWPVMILFIVPMVFRLPFHYGIGLALACLAISLPLERLRQSYRYAFLLPVLRDYLEPVLEHLESGPEGKEAEAAIPREVQVERSTEVLRRTVALLSYYGSMVSDNRSGFPVRQYMGFNMMLFFAFSFGVSAYLPLFGMLSGFVAVGIALLVQTRLLPRLLEPHKEQRITQRREQIRSRGLVDQVVQGTLPMQEMLNACPAWLHGVLSFPPIAKQHRQPGMEACWSLIWNLDWYLRQEGSSLRPGIIAEALDLLITMALPLLMMLVPLSFLLGNSSPGSGLSLSSIGPLFLWLFLMSLPLHVWILRTRLLQQWDSSAVIAELEQLVQDAELA
ncbi:hypothetical protein KDL44_10995 [bacterium]|nr:hypothetical protein [bacterium]